MTYEYYIESGYAEEPYFTRSSTAEALTIASEASLDARALRRFNLSLQNLRVTWDDLGSWDDWPRQIGTVSGRWEAEGQWLRAQAAIEAQARVGVIVDFSVQTSLVARAGYLRQGQAQIEAAAVTQIRAGRGRPIQAQVSTEFEIQTGDYRLRLGQSQQIAATEVAFQVQRQLRARATLSAPAAVAAATQVGYFGRADLSGQALIEALGRVISLDPDLTLTIDPETRIEAILEDVRLLRTTAETDLLAIWAESRDLRIRSETRQEKAL